MRKVAVVGAGAVGLSTAVNIQSTVQDVEVTLIADKFDVETTSDGAAGIFRPTLDKTPGVPLHILRKWLQTSWEHLNALHNSHDANEAGIVPITGYHFYEHPHEAKMKEFSLVKELTYNFEECSRQECENISARSFKFGFKYTTLLCEPRRYLPYLMKTFKAKHGKIIKRKITSLSELVNCYDVVVNSTGIGSRQLLGDSKVIAIKGHLIRVKAPWLKHFIYADQTYIIPGQDNVIIGGTKQIGVYELIIKKEDTDKIWESAKRLVPSLENAVWQREWVGLRPFRKPVRLEAERMNFTNGTMLDVVHNYGHGAEGISLSWGTGVQAAQLVQILLQKRLPLSGRCLLSSSKL